MEYNLNAFVYGRQLQFSIKWKMSSILLSPSQTSTGTAQRKLVLDLLL
jgi:hypothetical protein